MARWRAARADGLSVERAARAVGVPRATLYRWVDDAPPKSRRPRRMRAKSWTPALLQAVERLRQDFPMWGTFGRRSQIIELRRRTAGEAFAAAQTPQYPRERPRAVSYFTAAA